MSTMKLSFVQFSSGVPVPTTTPTTEKLSPKSTAVLIAPKYLYAPGPPALQFQFEFWVINGGLDTDEVASFEVPSADFDATAWYLQIGGNGDGTGVTTWAFSVNKNEVIPGATPIASVSVSGAWPGPPSTTVSTTISSSPVGINALSLLPPYGKFMEWFQLYGNGTISGSTLTVPAKGASAAIAFYGIPVPDPCQTIRDQIAALSPGDFPTLAAYKAALAALGKQLSDCEKAYGEAETP